MAKSEHVKLLGRGVKEWNRWRAESDERPDLSDVNLRRADLSGADLSSVNLSGADLSGADLCGVSLRRADLVEADLSGVSLRRADLSGADLSGAYLYGAYLHGAKLSGAKLSDASCTSSVFTDADLTQALGLETVGHIGPSSIGTDTLRKTADSLTKDQSRQGEIETFLRGAGLDEDSLEAFRLMIGSPIEFYSCFISYSHADKAIARRVYAELQTRGIRCWLDEHQLLPGDDIYSAVNQGIRLWDKVLLCCSQASLTSWWVENEIDTAFEKERKLRAERDGKPVLAVIPLNLDDSLSVWEDGRAPRLKSRLVADFTRWESDNAKFEEQFERVVMALRTGDETREAPPAPKL